MYHISTLHYPLDGKNITNSTITGKDTLLDSDIVIIDISAINNNTLLLEYYYENSNRRRDEINTLLDNGKIIIVLFGEFISIGISQHEMKRKGINRLSNYDFLPNLDIIETFLTPGKGAPNSIILKAKDSVFSQYYSAFKDSLSYSVYLQKIESTLIHPILVNKAGAIVGFEMTGYNGKCVFLPKTYSMEPERFVSVIRDCAKKYFRVSVPSAKPDWANKFLISGENILDSQIHELSDELISLKSKIIELEDEKFKVSKYKSLLYEQGPELESIVIDAFKLFGFNAENRKVGDVEHDIIFNSDEGHGIAEIEGKDKSNIHIEKLDQLNRAIDEDFEISEDYAQGVLIGNHYRFTDPEEREDPFTDKVYKAAKRKNIGLLTTLEVFKAVQKIYEDPSDDIFKLECRKRILNTRGELIKLVD